MTNYTGKIFFWTENGKQAGMIGRTGSIEYLIKWSGRKVWPLLMGEGKKDGIATVQVIIENPARVPVRMNEFHF